MDWHLAVRRVEEAESRVSSALRAMKVSETVDDQKVSQVEMIAAVHYLDAAIFKLRSAADDVRTILERSDLDASAHDRRVFEMLSGPPRTEGGLS